MVNKLFLKLKKGFFQSIQIICLRQREMNTSNFNIWCVLKSFVLHNEIYLAGSSHIFFLNLFATKSLSKNTLRKIWHHWKRWWNIQWNYQYLKGLRLWRLIFLIWTCLPLIRFVSYLSAFLFPLNIRFCVSGINMNDGQKDPFSSDEPICQHFSGPAQ